MIKNKIIYNDIKEICDTSLIDWENFRDRTFFITGATGGIGSFLVRVLLNANKKFCLNLKVIAAVRNIDVAMNFFDKKKVRTKYFDLFKYNAEEKINYKGNIDYIIHAASNTSSKSFIENPVETYNLAVKSTENLLNFAKEKLVKSFVYLSSMEVYGDIENSYPLKEDMLGKLNINDVRSSYPMGKRSAESLCYFYSKEYSVPAKVARLAQVIGANIKYDDTRVYANFARSIVEKKDIVLNTTAQTTRSYCYITDVISAILTILIKGENGECYNVSNEESTRKICDMAKELCEKYNESNLVFDIKDSKQFYKETHWVLDNSKLKSLGWEAKITLQKAYENLIRSFHKKDRKKSL